MKWHTVIFWSILLLLFAASLGASYVRFFISGDYLVTYSTQCDPNVASCFVDCQDDSCETQNFYMYVERPANDLTEMCKDDDFTLCLSQLNCGIAPGRECTETFCDSSTEECSDQRIIQ